MNDRDKKENQEQIKTDKDKKVELTIDELDKVTGGANFWFFDTERRRPKN